MEANFIGEVLDYLKCVVCQLVLKDPVLLVDCGHRLCQECFNQTRDHARRTNIPLLCPHDRNQVDEEQVVQDKGIARAILDLKVSCDYACDGCLWSGELRALRDHLDMQCSATALKRLTELMERRFEEKDEKVKELEIKFKDSIKHMEEKLRLKDVEMKEKIEDKEEKISHVVEELQLINSEMQHFVENVRTRDEKIHRIEEKLLLKDEEIAGLKYDLFQLKMKMFQSQKQQINTPDESNSDYTHLGSSGSKKCMRSHNAAQRRVMNRNDLEVDEDEDEDDDRSIVVSPVKTRPVAHDVAIKSSDAENGETGDELVEQSHQKDVEIGLLKLRLARMNSELFHLRRDTGTSKVIEDHNATSGRNKAKYEWSEPFSRIGLLSSNMLQSTSEGSSHSTESNSLLGKRNSSGKRVLSRSASQESTCSSTTAKQCPSGCAHCNRLEQLERRFMNVDDFVPNNFTKFTWKITNFSHHQNVGESLMSPKFYSSLRGHCCVLTLRWPAPEKHLALYFSLCRGNYGEVSGVPFDSNIRLKCTDKHGVENEWTIRHANMLGPGDERSPGRGYHEFIRKDSLADYVVNDALTITCIL